MAKVVIMEKPTQVIRPGGTARRAVYEIRPGGTARRAVYYYSARLGEPDHREH